MGFIFTWGKFQEEGNIIKYAKITPMRKFRHLQYVSLPHFVQGIIPDKSRLLQQMMIII